MWLFGNSRVFRVAAVAWVLAGAIAATDLAARPLDMVHSVGALAPSAEPFGLPGSIVTEGELREKWLGVARQIEDEMLVLALCQENRTTCPSSPALQFLTIVDTASARDGRARLGEINRSINMAIRPASDLTLHDAIDVWSSPLATFAIGAGDCEDYAIAKLVALREAGVSPDDLRIVIMHNPIRGDDHAVVAARLDQRWLILDNRGLAMIDDIQVKNYRPIFLIDRDGVKRYADPSLPLSEHRALKLQMAFNAPSQAGEIGQAD